MSDAGDDAAGLIAGQNVGLEEFNQARAEKAAITEEDGRLGKQPEDKNLVSKNCEGEFPKPLQSK